MSSSAAPTDIAQAVAPAPKKKGSKKKKASKPKPIDVDEATTAERENDEASDAVPPTPETAAPDEVIPPTETSKVEPNGNGHAPSPTTNGHPVASAPAASADPSAKLDAMTQERQALRAEVEQLRRQLETIQETHTSEVSKLKTDLEETEAAKEEAESQYQTLLGRVGQIKDTLGNRLKQDRKNLEEANGRIEELESQNEELQKGAELFEVDVAKLKDELQESTRELTSLRSRNNLSQQNWLKEKEDMSRHIQRFKGELESTSAAMGEWEVIAMEERSVRENLSEKVADLEEQLLSLREAYDRAAGERDAQSQATDGLQRALQEIQEARKKELREMVESSEEQLQAMKTRVQEADSRAAEAETARANLESEVLRTAPFEKEVREKNLLIGKLRHEAIILSDHLTKALKYIKKNKTDENVDREVVTNYFLQFLALDRSDPRKFQVLQVIAGLLNWTDEQREQAGLARPGTASNSLRLPTSPFHRTPSTPSLNSEFFSEPTPSSARERESLADLWAGFLERSVEEASAAGPGPGPGPGSGSRHDSMSSSTTLGTRPDTRG